MSEPVALSYALVVAADRDLGIGKDGGMPWRLPGDMAHFKTLTSATTRSNSGKDGNSGNAVNAVVMGRKTWDSIPPRFRPLRRRRNVVISRQSDLALPDGVLLASSLDQALRLAVASSKHQGKHQGKHQAEHQAERQAKHQAEAEHAPTVERVFIIGGGQIYADALSRPACQTIYFTRIDASFGCDVFLPPFEHDFHRTEILREGRDNDLDYRIEVWHRKSSS